MNRYGGGVQGFCWSNRFLNYDQSLMFSVSVPRVTTDGVFPTLTGWYIGRVCASAVTGYKGTLTALELWIKRPRIASSSETQGNQIKSELTGEQNQLSKNRMY
jgi:hypothetical protein